MPDTKEELYMHENVVTLRFSKSIQENRKYFFKKL